MCALSWSTITLMQPAREIARSKARGSITSITFPRGVITGRLFFSVA